MSKKEKSVQELTSAESKSIGFDYQYYFFLNEVLKIESEESVGYEVRDDVHIDKADGKQILIQLKHSVVTKASGGISNLSEKDIDLWKTISNWIEMINDKTEGRKELKEQLKYILNTSFILVTNKSITSSNLFFINIEEFQKGNISINNIRDYLADLSKVKKGKNSSVTDCYIKKLLKQDDTWLEPFLRNLEVKNNVDDLINLAKLRIKEKNVNDTRLEDVFKAVDSSLRKLIYDEVKDGNKVILTFSEYHKRFTKYFELGRSRKLPIRLNNPKHNKPADPEKHTSIKQLIDIEVINPEDEDFEDKIVEIFTCKYLMHNNLEQWIQDVDITEEQKDKFEQDVIKKWDNHFNNIHSKIRRKLRRVKLDDIDQEELIESAIDCYYGTLGMSLKIDETELDARLSNGYIYLLSDKPSIGWYFGWKERYKVDG
ncbi:ABC-three component system protein [Jeotgalibacillus salarius]|uniref:DUF4297 domain-containing protein n=1 Tax=Jeotgalibacillus salarius TaxID=546023 RepID=A0A4Y8LN58_9BACL|nr:ABC-three component system protein [Jeotgalibacillus salarius]TFE03847.1 hypothetical protein E2626_00535 [Jeotgalibacillus salarius]